MNLYDCNTVLNTDIAKSLKDFVDAVGNSPAEDFERNALAYIRAQLTEHQRIIFNGDGYSDEWSKEAERRGLLNLCSTVDALPVYLAPKNIKLFTDFHVLSEVELQSRYEVKLEQYAKLLRIEGATMSHMTKRKIAPAVSRYAGQISKTIINTKAAMPSLDTTGDEKLLTKLTEGCNAMSVALEKLDDALAVAGATEGSYEIARVYHDEVLAAMEELRVIVDSLEDICSTECWPIPTYNKILFYA